MIGAGTADSACIDYSTFKLIKRHLVDVATLIPDSKERPRRAELLKYVLSLLMGMGSNLEFLVHYDRDTFYKRDR